MSGRGPEVFYRDPGEITADCVIEQVVIVDGETVVLPLDPVRVADLLKHLSGNLARHHRAGGDP